MAGAGCAGRATSTEGADHLKVQVGLMGPFVSMVLVIIQQRRAVHVHRPVDGYDIQRGASRCAPVSWR